jgi:DNA-binding transcriptional ArsR family regulator
MKKTSRSKKISESKIRELADIMKLLGDMNRLRIAIICLEKPVCVSDIVKQTGLSQSLVSHHLRLMRTARLLKSKRSGKQIHYVINDNHIHCVMVDMIDHVLES